MVFIISTIEKELGMCPSPPRVIVFTIFLLNRMSILIFGQNQKKQRPCPPSTVNAEPTTNEAYSEHKNVTILPISSGSPNR